MLEALGELETEFESEFEGEGEFENEFESEFESEGENFDLGGLIGGLLGESEFESEFEGEGEFESEFMVNPVSRVYADAMMEHLGRAAMESESEYEAAEHFLPLIGLAASKLLPLAAKALPKIAGKVVPRIAKALTRATPRLTKGVTQMARVLHRNPQTRPLVRAIPSVARRTVASIAKQVAHGHPVTPGKAAQILTHHRRQVLGHPHLVRKVLHQSHRLENQAHRAAGLPAHHPHWRYWRGWRGHPYAIGGAPGAARPIAAGAAPIRAGSVPVTAWTGAPRGVAGFRSAACPTCGRSTGRRACCCCC
jgi:hypothetical protein